MVILQFVLSGFILSVGALAYWLIHYRNMGPWLGSYLRQIPRRRLPRPDEEVHLLLCIADHFEPKARRPAPEVSWARVRRWVEEYPRQFGGFRDSDGRTPRHSFFYPIEEYEEQYLDALAGLCQNGFGEVEIHLHHDRDTAENFRRSLLGFKELLAERHGLLARHRQTGAVMYGFVHGNWALDNSLPSGRHCGVCNELDILRETGCYADFTLPSAPSLAQTSRINSIYYAQGQPGRSKSHNWGVELGNGPVPERGLMLIQGPLVFDWRHRKRGWIPKLENGCLQGSQLPSIERLPLWLRARVQVRRRPSWFFVKLHAHGAPEESHEALLGQPMVQFHQELARKAAENRHFHYHYITSREMYNLVRAAEAGWQGSVADALDYELAGPPYQPGLSRLNGMSPQVHVRNITPAKDPY